jgi:hypothetical protein
MGLAVADSCTQSFSDIDLSMKRCAFLSMDSLVGFECYDELLYEPLGRLGWVTEAISWRSTDVDWHDFDAVLIRSTWDYQLDLKGFLDVLQAIDRSSARLENPLDLVKWNVSKTYLRDLEARGVKIVPTLWRQGLCAEQVVSFFAELDTGEIVIKPVVSANADDTFWLSRSGIDGFIPELVATFQERDCMVQPFMRGIVDEGEFSLFFFAGEYSHTILKTPQPLDFRVQEEHGGILKVVEPDSLLLARAKDTMKVLDPQPLYARVDLVRVPDDFAVMELELIEPSLYFNMDPGSPERFAQAFVQWMSQSEE